VLAILKDVRLKGRVFIAGMLVFSLTVILFALNRFFPLTLVLLFVSGCTSLVFSTMMTTMIQLQAPPDMRGRVMSLVTVTMQGFAPFGALLTGGLASRIGTPEAVAASAFVVAIAGIAALLVSPSIRDYETRNYETEAETSTQSRSQQPQAPAAGTHTVGVELAATSLPERNLQGFPSEPSSPT
jgi:MFS family permease